MINLLKFLTAGLMMSFAWPIRGQFGHEWGALIPGVMAAFIVSMLSGQSNWRSAFAQSVIPAGLFFSLGGSLSYGSIVDAIIAAPHLYMVIPQLIQVFVIGALWGALGCLGLGYGLFVKPRYALYFAAFGLVGFGGGFLIAVLILWFGSHGFLPGNWWILRDQIWGFIGGFSIFGAFMFFDQRQVLPNPFNYSLIQRLGFSFAGVFVTGINTWNVYQKWFESNPVINNTPLAAGFLILCGAILLIWLFFIWTAKEQMFQSMALNHMQCALLLFLTSYLTLLAILKSVGYAGMVVWETAFSLFIIELGIFLILFPLFYEIRE